MRLVQSESLQSFANYNATIGVLANCAPPLFECVWRTSVLAYCTSVLVWSAGLLREILTAHWFVKSLSRLRRHTYMIITPWGSQCHIYSQQVVIKVSKLQAM